MATVEAEAERSNERAEGVESKFIDIEDELKVSIDKFNLPRSIILKFDYYSLLIIKVQWLAGLPDN